MCTSEWLEGDGLPIRFQLLLRTAPSFCLSLSVSNFNSLLFWWDMLWKDMDGKDSSMQERRASLLLYGKRFRTCFSMHCRLWPLKIKENKTSFPFTSTLHYLRTCPPKHNRPRNTMELHGPCGKADFVFWSHATDDSHTYTHKNPKWIKPFSTHLSP